MRCNALAIVVLSVAVLTGTAVGQSPLPSLLAPSSGPAVRIGGYVQARGTYQDHTGLSFALNRVRLTVDGYLGGGFGYKVQTEFAVVTAGTASVSLRDAIIRWSHGDFGLTAGQYKAPFSREYMTSITLTETPDRAAVVDSLSPKRDIGLTADYTLSGIAYATFGIFNGGGQNKPVNADTTLLLVGRVAVRPISIFQVGVNVADTRDSTRYGADVGAEYRGFGLKGEYLTLARDFQNSPDKGWSAIATYRLLNWVQLVVRQEDFRRNAAVTHGYKNHATTGGVNLDFAAGKVKLAVDYVRRTLGNPGVTRGTVITQLQARF